MVKPASDPKRPGLNLKGLHRKKPSGLQARSVANIESTLENMIEYLEDEAGWKLLSNSTTDITYSALMAIPQHI